MSAGLGSWAIPPKVGLEEAVHRERRPMKAAGVACTVRDTRGREIAAACGQLAASQG